MTEADKLWFESRTKVFSAQIYNAYNQDCQLKMATKVVPSPEKPIVDSFLETKIEVAAVLSREKEVNFSPGTQDEGFICTVCLFRVEEGSSTVILSCRHVLHNECAK